MTYQIVQNLHKKLKSETIYFLLLFANWVCQHTQEMLLTMFRSFFCSANLDTFCSGNNNDPKETKQILTAHSAWQKLVTLERQTHNLETQLLII